MQTDFSSHEIEESQVLLRRRGPGRSPVHYPFAPWRERGLSLKVLSSANKGPGVGGVT